MRVQQLEHGLIWLLLLILIGVSISELSRTEQKTNMSLREFRHTYRTQISNVGKVLYTGYMSAYEYLRTKPGMGAFGGLLYIATIAFFAARGEKVHEKHQRPDANSGLMLGTVTMPLVFASQLYLHAHLGIVPAVTVLLWLALCCSTIALVNVYHGSGSVVHRAGPGLCEVFTACVLSHIAMVVKDGQTFFKVVEYQVKNRSVIMLVDTFVVCFFFAYTLHFLLHSTRYSFTCGEAVTVATCFSLLFTQATFSGLAHLLNMSPRNSQFWEILVNWVSRAIPLNLSSAHGDNYSKYLEAADDARFFNACSGLIVGVTVLGLFWFSPCVLPYRRRQMRKEFEDGQVPDNAGLLDESDDEEEAEKDEEMEPMLRQEHHHDIVSDVDEGDEDEKSSDEEPEETKEEEEDQAEASPDDVDEVKEVIHSSRMQRRGIDGSRFTVRRSPIATRSTTASHPTDAPAAASRSSRRNVRAVAAVEPEPVHPDDQDSSAVSVSSHPDGEEEEAELDEAAEAAAARRDKKAAQLAAERTAPNVFQLYLYLLIVIFVIIYPYIWMEMGIEPFTFILRYLMSFIPTEEDMFLVNPKLRYIRRDEGFLPPDMMYKSMHETMKHKLTFFKGFELDYTFFAQSTRLTLAFYWCVVMLVGVFIAAPAGRTTRRTEQVASNSAYSSVPSSNSSVITRASSTTRQHEVHEEEEYDSTRHWPNIVIRKYYHFLAVLMFVPAILIEPAFVALSFCVALAIFILLEFLRLGNLPPFGARIHNFMHTYLDLRDSGYIILTHIYLLIGCALPLWLHLHVLLNHNPLLIQSAFRSNFGFFEAYTDELDKVGKMSKTAAAMHHAYDSDSVPNALVFDMSVFLPALSGVLILGVGDSIASLVGTYLGQAKWFRTNRTIEGTVAAVLAIFFFAFGLCQFMYEINNAVFGGVLLIVEPNWTLFLISTCLTCLLEAFTTQIDNLFLPLFYYTALILIGT